MKPALLMGADDLAAEIAKANEAVPQLRCWQLHAMDRYETPRHCAAETFGDEKAIVLPEHIAVAAVRHVARVVREGVERLERRGIDRIMHAIVRQAARHIDAVALPQLPIRPRFLDA